MTIHDCQQGTSEWLRLRMGRPTASQFHRIVTPTGKLSAQADDYINELIAELVMGHPIDTAGMFTWAQRGKELEGEAVTYYEFMRDENVRKVGFVTTWDGLIGASPDGLVGDRGLLETKCPKPETHARYLFASLGSGVDRAYYPQLQGQLFVTERDWVDILSYHPEMPHAIVRVERDEKYIETLSDALRAFVDALAVRRETFEKRGWIVDRTQVNCEPVPLERISEIEYEVGDVFDEFDQAIAAGLV